MVTDNTNFINLGGLAFTLFMGLLLIILPRRYALAPILALTCFMTMGQRILVAGLDFPMIRILILFGWFRLIVRGEIRSIRWNTVDKLMLWWVLAAIVTHTLLWGTSDAFINRLGFAYNVVGLYFLFRCLVQNLEEAKQAFRILSVLFVPLAAAMLVEKATGRNPFAIFGGVLEVTRIRDGLLRVQGPFGHPILAGVFGAAALPLFVGLWWQRGWDRFFGAIGILSATVITLTSGSSTAVMAYLAGVGGLAMWPLRHYMRAFRWGLVFLILLLHLVMKAPVWFLIGRVSVVSGSTGYHRAYLVDRAIAHLGEWWFLGTKSTAHWGHVLHDLTNQYIRVGVDGGLVTLLLFIAIIALGFSSVGRALRAVGYKRGPSQFLLWSLGATLFAHVVSFVGISYWDQNIVNWYLLLAMIATLTNNWHLGRELGPQLRPLSVQPTAVIAHLPSSIPEGRGF